MKNHNTQLWRNDMTREEAIAAMYDGHKVTHKYFTSEEYLHVQGSRIYAEDGVYFGDVIYQNDFMIDGWRIYG